MKLYLTPGACSLADHIAMHEAGLCSTDPVDLERNGPKTAKTTPRSIPRATFRRWCSMMGSSDRECRHPELGCRPRPKLAPSGDLGRTRLIEMLAFIATELHKPFGRFFFPTSDAEKQAAEDTIRKRLDFLAGRLRGDYLFGSEFSVADAYLYVMLRWARMKGLDLPEPLPAFVERMNARPAVRLALQHEGLA